MRRRRPSVKSAHQGNIYLFEKSIRSILEDRLHERVLQEVAGDITLLGTFQGEVCEVVKEVDGTNVLFTVTIAPDMINDSEEDLAEFDDILMELCSYAVENIKNGFETVTFQIMANETVINPIMSRMGEFADRELLTMDYVVTDSSDSVGNVTITVKKGLTESVAVPGAYYRREYGNATVYIKAASPSTGATFVDIVGTNSSAINRTATMGSIDVSLRGAEKVDPHVIPELILKKLDDRVKKKVGVASFINRPKSGSVELNENKYVIGVQKSTGKRGIFNRLTKEFVPETDPRFKELARLHRANMNRSMRDDAYKSLGLTKVKGAMGGTYYESYKPKRKKRR